MKPPNTKPPAAVIRCAIYTRKSTEEGLEKEFNSLDAHLGADSGQDRGDAAEGQMGRGSSDPLDTTSTEWRVGCRTG